MEVQKEMEKDYKRARIRRFVYIAVTIIVVLILSLPLFTYFKIQTGSHLALREAKNIKLAFELLSVEYYADNKSVYNPRSVNGIDDNIKERVLETTEEKGDIRILSYNKNKRAVEAFVYETDKYQVTYRIDENGEEHWTVKYLWTVEDLSGGKG